FEFAIDRDFVEAFAVVTDDLDVGGGGAANSREGRLPNNVVAHDHVAGAEHVDGVSVLTAAAGPRGGVLDAIVGDDAAVAALAALPHADAAIARAADDIARNHHPAAVDAEQRVIGGTDDSAAGHFAVAFRERDRVAAGVQDLAIGDWQGTHLTEIHEPAILRKVPAAALEREPGERDVVRLLGGEQRRPAREFDARCAAHAEKLRAGRQLEAAGAVEAGAQHQRRAHLRGTVDGALQLGALVARDIGANAELHGVEAIDRQRRG